MPAKKDSTPTEATPKAEVKTEAKAAPKVVAPSTLDISAKVKGVSPYTADFIATRANVANAQGAQIVKYAAFHGILKKNGSAWTAVEIDENKDSAEVQALITEAAIGNAALVSQAVYKPGYGPNLQEPVEIDDAAPGERYASFGPHVNLLGARGANGMQDKLRTDLNGHVISR